MANHHQQSPEGNYDPAGSTQMFRAFVDEGAPGGGRSAAAAGRGRKSGPGAGVIVGVVVAIAVVVGAVLLAMA
ncbi:hypothetical protein [Streptomyces cinnamoneus]|uniref:hypothetical protein n=1 Tax=Streptomyces sp. NPDC053079 TaxID=3365697 RepID=UPI000903CAB0